MGGRTQCVLGGVVLLGRRRKRNGSLYLPSSTITPLGLVPQRCATDLPSEIKPPLDLWVWCYWLAKAILFCMARIEARSQARARARTWGQGRGECQDCNLDLVGSSVGVRG